MRTALENQASIHDRKGLARHQLNLPIARMPITIQSTSTSTSIRSSTGRPSSISLNVPFSPIMTSSPTAAWPPRPMAGSTDFGTYLSQPSMLIKTTNADQGAASRPHLRISAPRHPKLPKLNLQVPDISPQFYEPCPGNSADNTNSSNTRRPAPTLPSLTNTNSSSSNKANRVNSNGRRVSWSPSQAIPEGHYSKGFTLTNFQKTADKPSSSSAASTSSSSSSSSTASSVVSATPSSLSSASSLKRSNTNQLQRRESFTPFRRLVGRSKSMKVKTTGPFVINTETESSTALRTERFNSFYNDDRYKENPISPQTLTQKTIEMFGATNTNSFKDRNMMDKDNPTEHSNGIQAQDRGTITIPSFMSGGINASAAKDNAARKGAVAATLTPTGCSLQEPMPSVSISTPPSVTSNMAKSMMVQPLAAQRPVIAIATMGIGPCKPLWQHTMTTAEQIRELGLSSQEIQKQETIFELIYTESEYLDDLKSIHKIFVEELNVKMAESRRRKRFSPDKADVKLYERLARLLSHIKDLWNGHQSLLRSLQNKQQQESPVVEDIGGVFESFYMFSIYDSYFAQYTTTSRDFQQIAVGNSELCLIIKDLLKSPRCKSLSLEGIFLKPIQRLQKYPLFFKDLLNMTSKTDPDHSQLEHALNNHQRELTKIDDRIWVEEHNEMLTDLQQRIKGLPSHFSLVERHRYLILDGPVHRITVRQPSKFSFGKHGTNSKSESCATPHQHQTKHLHHSGSSEWRGDGFRSPVTSLGSEDDNAPIMINRPSQLDYHHLHAKPAFPSTPPSSSASSASSSHSGLATPSSSSPSTPTFKISRVDPNCVSPRQRSPGFFYSSSPSSPPVSATTLHSLSSVPSPIPIPNSNTSTSLSSPSYASAPSKQPTVSQLVSHYNFNLSSSFSSFTGTGHPKNISSSALYLPGIIKNSTDVEAEYHVFIFTDIVLWTKRVMSRYHRKEGTPWNFKLVEPVSKLTSVYNSSEENIFMCTSVNTSSASYLVRTEDEIAARMWRTTIPTLVPFHCSRNLKDRGKK